MCVSSLLIFHLNRQLDDRDGWIGLGPHKIRHTRRIDFNVIGTICVLAATDEWMGQATTLEERAVKVRGRHARHYTFRPCREERAHDFTRSRTVGEKSRVGAEFSRQSSRPLQSRAVCVRYSTAPIFLSLSRPSFPSVAHSFLRLSFARSNSLHVASLLAIRSSARPTTSVAITTNKGRSVEWTIVSPSSCILFSSRTIKGKMLFCFYLFTSFIFLIIG